MGFDNTEHDLMLEVFDKLPSAIIILDSRGIIKKANTGALSLLGESVLEGRRWVEVITEIFRPRSDDGHEISTRDGKRVSVTTVPLKIGQIVQITDLTETREMQDKLSHMERLSSLGKMAASLAHQIRTPLSAAMLYGANLGNANLPATARVTFQKKLMSRLEALEAQVSDILMFARSGEQTVAKMDAVDLIEQVFSNVVSIITKYNVNLIKDIEERPIPILANSVALSGAISNLVANASEAGCKNILVKLVQDKSSVKFIIANDGPEIPSDLKPRIFEPFVTSKSNGTGLGLAVVHAVAKVHQGDIILSSSDEYKTVFTLTIPKLSSLTHGISLNQDE